MLERWVQDDLQPDVTVYFDVSPAVGRSRAGAIKSADRFEQEQEAYHVRVREAYLRRARECPDRIRVVDAERSLAQIRDELSSIFSGLSIE